MDLWHLHIFCRVVECKSFSKAAAAVHLSQPTVSSHIRELEHHFGCLLIDRLAKQALPTQAGRLLYGYGRRLLALREEAEAAMAQHQGKRRGSLVIGASTLPGTYLLPRVVGKYKKLYPHIRLTLRVEDSQRIVGGILEGELEFGLVGAESRDRHIMQERLMEDRLRLVVPAGHRWATRKKIPLSRLLTEPFIVREQGSGTLKSIQEILMQAHSGTQQLNVAAEMGSTEAIRQAIKDGVGVSILSTLAVADDLESGSLKALQVEGLSLSRWIFLVRHRQRSLSPLAEAFIDALRQHLAR